MKEIKCIIYDDSGGMQHETVQISYGNGRGATGITIKFPFADNEVFVPGDEYLSEEEMYAEDTYKSLVSDNEDLANEIEALEKENKRLQEEIEALEKSLSERDQQ